MQIWKVLHGTVTTAVSAALLTATTANFVLAADTPAPQPLNMVVELPGMAPGLDTLRVQAVLERYPEMTIGPDRDGTYLVAAAFRKDGSIYQSHMRFIDKTDRYKARDELSALLPPDGRSQVSAMARKGEWANGGHLPADIMIEGTLLPADFDEATSAKRVQDAVRSGHSNLMLSPLGNKLNLLTVFMTKDGRIDRENVQTVTRKDFGNMLPEYASEDHFKVLGLKPEELGRMDMTTISRAAPGAVEKKQTLPDGSVFTLPPEQEYLIILYAWPRGVGVQAPEPRAALKAPAGAMIPIARDAAARAMSDPEFQRENKRRGEHVISEVVKRYPEIVDGPERDGYFTFVLVFRPDGSVYRDGMRYAADQPQTNKDRQELSDSMRERTTGVTSMDIRRKGDVLPNGKVLKAEISYTYSVLGGGFESVRLPGNPQDHSNTLRRMALQEFPELLSQPEKFKAARPWVLLDYDGFVIRTGRAFMEPTEIFLASKQLGPLMPGVKFAEVEAAQSGTRRDQSVNVMFVWLAADSPLPPPIN